MPFTISSSVTPFSSCLQSFPASGSFQMSRFLKVEPGVLERCWKGKVESRKMVLKTRKSVCVRNSFIQWLCYLELGYSLWGFMTSSLEKVGGLPLSLLKNVCEILEPKAVQVAKGFVREDGCLEFLERNVVGCFTFVLGSENFPLLCGWNKMKFSSFRSLGS